MSTPLLPSFRRQQLVLDLEGCPEGLYLSLTPGNPSLWSGVLFVREGPYAGAVLRFEIAFPDSYPDDPPLVTFSSDIFHPLVVPLTTYTFAASVVDASSTISAADQDRLPPGAFSLRHGFPHWFRARDSTTGDQIDTVKSARRDDENESKPGVSANDHMKTSEDVRVPSQAEDRKDLMLKMLSYIKKAFENDALLDEMPLEAAGDPSAWHAWRAYRGLGKEDGPKSPAPAAQDGVPASPKRPSEWKWDGVWESRVTNGIETSVSEATLFGSASGGRAGQASVDTTKSDVRQAMVTNSNRQIRFCEGGCRALRGVEEGYFDLRQTCVDMMAKICALSPDQPEHEGPKTDEDWFPIRRFRLNGLDCPSALCSRALAIVDSNQSKNVETLLP